MDKDSLIKVGYVARTHGLKGEVTLNLSDVYEPITDDMLVLETKFGLVPYFVEQASTNGTKAFVKFSDTNSIEAAMALKGCSVYLEKTKRPKLKRGEFYDDELIGFQVVDSKEGVIGKVENISNQGLNKLLEVGSNNILIPLNSPFIITISKAKRKIEVELPDGFLEI